MLVAAAMIMQHAEADQNLTFAADPSIRFDITSSDNIQVPPQEAGANPIVIPVSKKQMHVANITLASMDPIREYSLHERCTFDIGK